MIERILQKLYDEYYPDRDIQVLIVNGRVKLAINDTAQASYSIKGTYRYEEVQNLNQFTNGFCSIWPLPWRRTNSHNRFSRPECKFKIHS